MTCLSHHSRILHFTICLKYKFVCKKTFNLTYYQILDIEESRFCSLCSCFSALRLAITSANHLRFSWIETGFSLVQYAVMMVPHGDAITLSPWSMNLWTQDLHGPPSPLETFVRTPQDLHSSINSDLIPRSARLSRACRVVDIRLTWSILCAPNSRNVIKKFVYSSL